eukprot:SAG31_NODE_2867_length_4979_cov_2.330123_6_plen_72_part_00
MSCACYPNHWGWRVRRLIRWLDLELIVRAPSSPTHACLLNLEYHQSNDRTAARELGVGRSWARRGLIVDQA